MKLKFSLVLLLTYILTDAQSNYESGYIIDKSGNRIDCLIENKDKFFNPTSFRYKLNESSEVLIATTKNSRTVEIENEFKFISKNVQVDVSPTNDLKLDYNKSPKYEERTVFLRQLVEGEANLFLYREENLEQFFYSLNNNIDALTYKRYFKQDNNNKAIKRTLTNEDYKSQLYSNLKCETIDLNVTRKLDYSEKSLINYFSNYNICKIGVGGVIKKDNRNNKFYLRAKAGLAFNQLDVNFIEPTLTDDLRSVSFNSETSFRFGFELEYNLKLNNYKWSLFIEPSFMNFISETRIREENFITIFEDTATINYEIIEIPIGVRHYMYINDKSSLFANIALIITHDLSDSVIYENQLDVPINTGLSAYFGLGYDYNKKISIEARLYSEREVVSDFGAFDGPFTSAGIILGYQFL